MTTTIYTQEALAELIARCVAYTIIKTEVATMRGSQKHIIQQDREGVYTPRTRAEFQLTNITFCGIALQEWEQALADVSRDWFPTHRYYNSACGTKKTAIAELQQDFISYNAEELLKLLNPSGFTYKIKLAEQVIAQMQNHTNTEGN